MVRKRTRFDDNLHEEPTFSCDATAGPSSNAAPSQTRYSSSDPDSGTRLRFKLTPIDYSNMGKITDPEFPEESVGRRGEPKYHESHPARAYAIIAKNGVNDATLANAFGVRPSTICNWLVDHIEFYQAYKQGWDAFTSGEVRRAITATALGFTVPEEKVFCHVVGGVNGDIQVTRVDTEKFYPPNPAMLQFLACNLSRRQGTDEWQNVNKIEMAGKLQTEETGPASKALADLIRKAPVDKVKELRDSIQRLIEDVQDVNGSSAAN